jgi:ABC-2 type transport system ATP-binding protein
LKKTDDIGKIAFENKIAVLELAKHNASLEEVFLELTEGAQEYQTHDKGKK